MLPRAEDYVLLGSALTSDKNSSGHGILRQFCKIKFYFPP